MSYDNGRTLAEMFNECRNILRHYRQRVTLDIARDAALRKMP